MAVHVMLDFDSDAEAKEFVVDVIANDGVSIDHRTYPDDGVTIIKCTPRGVWKKPTSFCDDQEPGHRSEYLKRIKSKMGGWTRGKKYGWWVDPACGRPTRNWGEGDRWWYSLGTNLLPRPWATEDKGQDVSDAVWKDLLPGSPSQEG